MNDLTTDSASVNPSQETIAIPLGKNCIAFIDAVDSDLANLKWYVGFRGGRPYAERHNKYKASPQRLHRVITARVVDRMLSSHEIVDHIDGNSLNNTRSNLRICTRAQNCLNSKRPKHNTSGYKGVAWSKKNNKWQATIKFNGKLHWLGLFDTPEEAHKAYCKAATELHGEFARFE